MVGKGSLLYFVDEHCIKTIMVSAIGSCSLQLKPQLHVQRCEITPGGGYLPHENPNKIQIILSLPSKLVDKLSHDILCQL